MQENDIPDADKINEILTLLKFGLKNVKSVHRVGKKNVNEPNDGNRDEVFQRQRPLRVVLENKEVKWKMVKSAPEIKKV